MYQSYLEATGDNTPAVIASTASPFKFCSSVTEGLFPEIPAGQDEFYLLKLLAERCVLPVPRGLQGLENRAILHKAATTPGGMKAAVGKVLGLAE